VPEVDGLHPALMAAVTPAIDSVSSRRAGDLIMVGSTLDRLYGRRVVAAIGRPVPTWAFGPSPWAPVLIWRVSRSR